MSRPLGSHRMIGLIPARAGSQRCPGKNTRLLGGQPLIRWSIDAAQASHLFTEILVSTDDAVAAQIAQDAGVLVHPRQPDHATATAPDILWVRDALEGRPCDLFAILRPTSPFRTASTIRRAYAMLVGSGAHSVRAVEKVSQHPGKMWVDDGKLIRPLLDRRHDDGTPWHSSPTQSLPRVYLQNASLEMAWTWVVAATGTISGLHVAPLLTDPVEGFDINTPEDFDQAARLMETWLPAANQREDRV